MGEGCFGICRYGGLLLNRVNRMENVKIMILTACKKHILKWKTPRH